MARPILVAALAAAALASAACNTAKPAPQFVTRMAMTLPVPPHVVMSALRTESAEEGGAIAAETADSLTVDYGVQARRIPVPSDYGLWGTRVTFRTTEVHRLATYIVTPSPDGSVVTILSNPIYWHPDYRVWLPGPHDTAPGLNALVRMAGMN